jgi:predicted metal-dependent phosphotriesterase family hydrolase
MATVNTVLGPIDAQDLGGTMSHTHLTINLLCWHEVPDSPLLRRLSESEITLQNYGLVRRNPTLFKDNLLHDDLSLEG